jgi:phenylalanyl-tRNA synthetase beta chain
LKILASWLRDFVDVRLPVTELASLLSMRGFEVASIEPVASSPESPLRPTGRAPAGTGLQPCDDGIIDFEITANRPDCLSVVGFAREAATSCRLPLRLPWDEAGRPISGVRPVTAPTPTTVSAAGLEVTIEDADLCPRYAAAVAEVKTGASPAWLADRLMAAGVRPINNVVDVTNYVLIEMGHPMHAFDLEKLGGRQLRARRARAGESLRTLDGENRTLDPEILVIADAGRPQAVAGVMGGAESEVWAGTRLVALESAWFKPASVRRTSRRLGLKTEASTRFERGADISAAAVAIERACALFEQIGAGRRVGEGVDCYPAPRGPVRVKLRREWIARLLGLSVGDADVTRIFAGLGFEVEEEADGWLVRVPTMRVDVTREADLIEEVARHHGYDRVPSTFPPLRSASPRPEPGIARRNLLRHVLTAAGFSEAISYSLVEAAAATPFLATAVERPAGHESAAAGAEPSPPADRLVPLAYPLSEKLAVLRPSLLPGLVDAVAHNRRRENADVRLFEIGSCFLAKAGEHHRLAFVWAGAGTPEHWRGGHRPVDFFDAKGVVERLGEALRVRLAFADASRPYLVPGRTAAATADGVLVGVIGQIAPALAHARDVPGTDDLYAAELDLDTIDTLVPADDIQCQPLPRFPSIVRDISIVVDEGLRSEHVRATIRRSAPETLAHVAEFDRYTGKGVPEGRYSLSLRLTFRSPDRTLTDVEVQAAMARVMDALAREHRAVQR